MRLFHAPLVSFTWFQKTVRTVTRSWTFVSILSVQWIFPPVVLFSVTYLGLHLVREWELLNRLANKLWCNRDSLITRSSIPQQAGTVFESREWNQQCVGAALKKKPLQRTSGINSISHGTMNNQDYSLLLASLYFTIGIREQALRLIEKHVIFFPRFFTCSFARV